MYWFGPGSMYAASRPTMRYVVAIIGMTAVGIIVWRLLQWQERRQSQQDEESDDKEQHDR